MVCTSRAYSLFRVDGGCKDVNRARCSYSRVWTGIYGVGIPRRVGTWESGKCPGDTKSRSVGGPDASALSRNRLGMQQKRGEGKRRKNL